MCLLAVVVACGLWWEEFQGGQLPLLGMGLPAPENVWENVLKMDKRLESALQPLGVEQSGKDCWQAIMATGWSVNEEESRAESSVVPGGNMPV